MSYNSSFWDTNGGQRLAAVLAETLPHIEEKMNVLVQLALAEKKPTSQMSVYVKPERVQEYVNSQIRKGKNLVAIIDGATSRDDKLVVLSEQEQLTSINIYQPTKKLLKTTKNDKEEQKRMKMLTIKLNDKEQKKKEEKIIMAIECMIIIAVRVMFILLSLYYFFKIDFTPEISNFMICFIVGIIICAIPVRKFVKNQKEFL